MGGGGKGGGKQTVGYKYYLGLHMAIAHGPLDRLLRIRVGGKTAWSGSSTGGRININKPGLFGGESREGGVVGALDYATGGPDQTANDYLAARLGSTRLPAFRGVAACVLRQMYIGMNPYLKNWEFRAQRIHTRQDGQEQWYPEKAAVLTPGPSDQIDLHAILNAAPSAEEGLDVGITISGYHPDEVLTLSPAATDDSVYIAWSPWGQPTLIEGDPDSGAVYEFRVIKDNDASSETTYSAEGGPFDGYAAARQAFIDQHGAISLSGASSYTLYIRDRNPVDNSGGLSLELNAARDMNPAHIIREGLTDPGWGMGHPEADIDDTSFRDAADTLYDEGLGLSLLWDRQQAIEEFIQLVLQHIDGHLFVEPTTGLWTLRLVRDDYDAEDLITLDESNVERLDNVSRPAFGELVNSVTVQFWDARSGNDDSITVQDIALAQQQGAEINTTVQYPGVTNGELASRLASRELRALSNPLLSCTLYTYRTAEDLRPGDAFRLAWPDYGIEEIIMRVVDIAFGDGRSHAVRIKAVQDVFALPEVSLTQPAESEWEAPEQDPQPVEHQIVIEMPYYELVQRLGERNITTMLEDAPELGYIGVAAAAPSGTPINARLATDAGGGYEESVALDFCPTAVTAEALGPGDEVVAITAADLLDSVEVDTYAQLEDEWVVVTAVSDTSLSIGRGVLDTVPAAHPAGTRILFIDGFLESDEVEYTLGDEVAAKVLPVAPGGQLDIEEATADSATMDQRALRPYPPGNVTINGEYFPETIGGSADLSLAWSHRDRLQQTAGLVDFTRADIGPETGTTYTLRIYGENGVLGRTTEGLTASEWEYPISEEVNDFQIPIASTSFGDPTAVLTTLGASLSGSGKWRSGALAADGRIYAIPFNATDILIIDPAAGTATRDAMGASLSGSGKWSGGVAGGDGKIYGIPLLGGNILIIDPAAGTATRDTMGASIGTDFEWFDGVLANDGKIYAIPFNATDILIIDPAAGTATRDTMGASLSGSGKWKGGVLGNDGKIYGIPADATDILIIDPAAGTATRDTMGASLAGSGKWSGGVAGGDGKIYAAPYDATDILIIDPASGTATRDAMGASLSGSSKWNGGVLGRDGRIYGIPETAQDILVIEVDDNTASRSTMELSLATDRKWYSAVKDQAGEIYSIPYSSDEILIIDPGQAASYRPNGRLRIELESERDGLTSYYHHDITVRRAGYGFNYGMYYGGAE